MRSKFSFALHSVAVASVLGLGLAQPGFAAGPFGQGCAPNQPCRETSQTAHQTQSRGPQAPGSHRPQQGFHPTPGARPSAAGPHGYGPHGAAGHAELRGHNRHPEMPFIGQSARRAPVLQQARMSRLPPPPSGQHYRVMDDRVVRVDNTTLAVLAIVGLTSQLLANN